MGQWVGAWAWVGAWEGEQHRRLAEPANKYFVRLKQPCMHSARFCPPPQRAQVGHNLAGLGRHSVPDGGQLAPHNLVKRAEQALQARCKGTTFSGVHTGGCACRRRCRGPLPYGMREL